MVDVSVSSGATVTICTRLHTLGFAGVTGAQRVNSSGVAKSSHLGFRGIGKGTLSHSFVEVGYLLLGDARLGGAVQGGESGNDRGDDGGNHSGDCAPGAGKEREEGGHAVAPPAARL